MAEKLEFDLAVKNNQLNKALDEGSKKAEKLGGTLTTALAVFGGNLITKGFDTLVGGLGSVIDIGKQAIAAAAGQEVAVNNLNYALARQGNYTKEASKELQDFATQMQATTVYEDDAVIASTALLQSLTKLNKDGLQKGVSAAADFATVLGIDLETATRLVAKSAEGQVEAFKRYGVEIKKGSSNTESFANTIEALNKQFGGAAAAQLNTFSGSLGALTNAYGDLLEPVGDIIVKNPLFVSTMNEVRKAIVGATDATATAVPALQTFINDTLIVGASVSLLFADAISGITAVLRLAINGAQIFGAEFATSLIEPLENGIEAVIKAVNSVGFLSEAFGTLENPLKGATEALQAFSADGVKGANDVMNSFGVDTLSDQLDRFYTATIEGSAEVAIAQAEAIKNNKTKVDNELQVNADILAAKAQLNIDLLLLQSQLAAEELAFEEQKNALGAESELLQNELKLEAIYNQKIAEAQAVYEGELLKNNAIKNAQQKKLANDKAYATLSLTATKAANAQELATNKALNDAKVKLDKDLEADRASSLATIASMSSANNKTLAGIGKAAALTQIAISGPVAVAKAFAAFPPPFNFAAAASVAAAVAMQASKVVGIQFANGGFINGAGGATMGGDNTMASVRSGEMVLNASQQGKLFDAINGNGISGAPIIVQIDGREIARAVRNQMQSGFQLA